MFIAIIFIPNIRSYSIIRYIIYYVCRSKVFLEVIMFILTSFEIAMLQGCYMYLIMLSLIIFIIQLRIQNKYQVIQTVSYILYYQGRKVDSTPLAMYNYFIERVKQNLHVALAMSPIGDAFRNRLRMFPSLINCCTIDWFQVRITQYLQV